MGYTTSNVFADSRANALMDRILYEIENAIPGVNLLVNVCLTGRAAAQLQDYTLTEPCNNLVLLTNHTEVYAFVQDTLPRLLQPEGVTRYKERTIFYFGWLIIEFWITTGSLHCGPKGQINVQFPEYINPILL
jgi:hypothetical protein